jgi:hypothetical protein
MRLSSRLVLVVSRGEAAREKSTLRASAGQKDSQTVVVLLFGRYLRVAA